MGKISPVSAKYIIHGTINIEGIVDRPDVIGAIFGQTEGLLGSELELRELQRSGRVGRIEVRTETKSGKTNGTILIPSSLDKAETCIIAAALEIIQRIGPCNAKIKVGDIEDVRTSKRNFVVERAKELLKTMVEKVMPDSQEIADEVAYSVRVMEITEYGKDRLSAGPNIDDSDELIVVEGRADVVNLLKHGFKNVIALNGTSVPETIIELSKKKIVTVFIDGDRGGDLIVKGLLDTAEMDFVAKAPDGKEVEEITKKEIHKALRSKIAVEQVKLEMSNGKNHQNHDQESKYSGKGQPVKKNYKHQQRRTQQVQRKPSLQRKKLSIQEKDVLRGMTEELIGTRGAFILDQKMNVLGKVPVSELATTIRSLGSTVYAVALDGPINRELIQSCERAKVQHLVGTELKVRPSESRINLETADKL